MALRAEDVKQKDETVSDAAVSDFIERMGIIVQADGLPRIAGRLMGFFVIHGGPVSFGELAERLQVSRASISNNTRLLEQLGVIERVSRPGDRQDYFQLAEVPYRSLLEGVVERMTRARSAVGKAAGQLPAEWRGTQARLAELDDFYARAVENTQALIKALRDEAD